MVPIYKETFEFEEEISINNFKKLVYENASVDEVFQTKRSINFNLKREIGNRGIIRLFWSKLSMICKPNRNNPNEYKVVYKLDGVSFFMLFMLMAGIYVEYAVFDSGKQERDIPVFALPIMGIIYLLFIVLELRRAKKVVNDIF